ncbi:MAG: hypothetical protein ACXABO_18220 [Promethearchaeota archaeon]|jgi:hypothetical protein
MTEIDKNVNGPNMARPGCCPALTVAKLDIHFKRFLDRMDEKVGDDKVKAEKWEINLRKAFFQFK